MIYKRYQHFTNSGVKWTEWRKLCDGTEEDAKRLNKEERWQLRSSKLLNEFKYVEQET